MHRIKQLLPAVLFIASFCVYLATICPTVYVGDSGEMIPAAYHLGIAHPPGYPLYCMAGKVMSYIPAGTIAFRVNLTAALFASLAVSMLYLLLSLFAFSAESLIPAVFCALAFAFSRTFWAQSEMTKGGLYTLNALLTILLLILLMKIRKAPEKRFTFIMIMLGLISGMGLANHNTIVPLLPFIFAYAIYALPSKNRLLAALLYPAVTVLTAFLLYMYLPIRSAANPPMDWGHPADFYGFLNHVLRKQYATSVEPRSIAVFFGQIWAYIKFMSNQFSLFPVWLALPGIYFCHKKGGKAISALLLILFLLTSLGFILLNNFKWTAMDLYVNEVFFIPSYLATSAWMYFGVLWVMDLFTVKAVKAMVVLVSAFCFVLPFSLNYKINDRSNNYIAYDFGRNILKTPATGAVLFLSGDNPTFLCAYLKMVEKARPDTDVYDDYGRVFKNIYGPDFLRMAAGVYEKRLSEVQRGILNSSGRIIYCYPGSNIDNMDDINTHYEGILKRVGKLKGKAKQLNYSIRGIDDPQVFKDYFCRELIGQYFMTNGDQLAALGANKEAMKEYEKAMDVAYDSPSIQNSIGQAIARVAPEKSASFYENVMKDGAVSSDLYNNLGTAYYKAGKIDASIEQYLKALDLDKKYYKSYFNLGVSYLGKQDLKRAKESFLECISLCPTYTEAYYAMGNINFMTGKYDIAVKFYSKTVELNPVYSVGWNAIGASLYSLGRQDEAIKAYTQALKLDPSYQEAAGNLALLYISRNEKQTATVLLEEFLKRNPENEKIKAQLKSLR